MVSPATLAKARLIDRHAQDYLHKNRHDEAKPAELMPYLIEKGVFNTDYREGLPLRRVLRELERNGQLGLIRGAYYVQKLRNKYWYIRRV